MNVRRAVAAATVAGCVTVLVLCSDISLSRNFSYLAGGDAMPVTMPPQGDPGGPRNGTNVLILSSVGRSGSSFLGELVTSMADSFFYLEPMVSLNVVNATREETVQEFSRIFKCDIRDGLFTTSLGRQHIRLSTEKNCQYRIRMTDNEALARYACRTFPMVIVKTIRARLQWITSLMDDQELDLRILHLVRDPRPVRMSARRLWWSQDYIDSVCKNLLEDFQYKDIMEMLYPGRYLFLRYEDVMRDIYNKTAEIWRFVVRGQREAAAAPNPFQELPFCVKKFVSEHTTSTSLFSDDFSTSRDSSSTYQRWRVIITQEELTTTETVCNDTLTRLGYKIFTTVETARNLSIPVWTIENP